MMFQSPKLAAKRLTRLPLIVTYVPHVCVNFTQENVLISTATLVLLISLQRLVDIINFIAQSFYFSVKLQCLLEHLFNCWHFLILATKDFLKETIVSAGLSIEVFV